MAEQSGAYHARLLIVAIQLRVDDTVEITAKRLSADEWEDSLTFSVAKSANWLVGSYIDVMAHPVRQS